MKYKIGTRIDFIDEGDREDDLHEYWKIIAYAITKEDQVVYLIWSSYNEYDNEYNFMTDDELSKEIKDYEYYDNIVKIKEEE